MKTKTKLKNKNDVAGMMVLIQEQLAVMNEKLDSFMTKSLSELAQALAASKPVVRTPPPAVPQSQGPVRPSQHEFLNRRQMYAVVCYECGKDAELPFKPSGDRPVYCPECFAARKGRTPPSPVSAGKLGAPSMSSPSLQSTTSTTSPAKETKKAAPAKSTKAKRATVKKPAAKKKTAVKKTAKKKK